MDYSTKEKIGWGILGPGRIANQFCDCLQELPDAYVAAVGSRSMERSVELTSRYGGTPYGSYEEMLADPNVDIVYVATPHPMHEKHVIMAAKAGKNILCEKPFAVNRAQAERMFAAARENDVFIMEGLWSRFFPAWQYVKEQLVSGRFGNIEAIDARTAWGGPRNNPNVDPTSRIQNPELAGGSLLDAGIYSLAAMSRARGKFDEPTEFFSMMAFEPTGVDGDDDMMMRFEDGMVAYLSSSLHRGDQQCRIVCEKGIITIPVNRDPDRVIITERPSRPPMTEEQRERAAAIAKKNGPRDYYGSMDGLPISQRRMGGMNTTTMDFPYRKTGFQFEAEVVQDCLRKGLKICPDVTPEETLFLIGLADRCRENAGYYFPFENGKIQ